MSYLAGEGFNLFFGKHGLDEHDAHQWRQRHLVRALASRGF